MWEFETKKGDISFEVLFNKPKEEQVILFLVILISIINK